MTPLQHEPSAHAPWMRTIFGRAFISGNPSSFPDDRADPTMPSSPAGRYPQHYCTSDTAKTTGRSEDQILLSERPVVAHFQEPARQPFRKVSVRCSQATDTPAAALLRKMATRHDRERIPR